MPRRLSSVLTFFWKFFFPALWFAGSGLITLLSFAESQGFTHRDTWSSLASWLLGFSLFRYVDFSAEARPDGRRIPLPFELPE